MLFYTLFSPVGPVNALLTEWGVIDQGFDFFANKVTVRGMIMLMNFLLWFGNTTILLMAGIMGIDQNMIDAAEIDGANSIQVLFRVTLPLLMPILVYTVRVLPNQVYAVGFYQMCVKLGWTNSYIPLILPGIASPVVFFYMKQYMESVLPMEVVDSARVDGSGEFYTFNRIVLPMLKPAMAVQLIFSFVRSWNNYFIPALLLDKAEMKTVPIMIAQLRSADYSKFDMGKVYMFILLAILPVMVVYICLSKSIIKGVTAGSVKG